MYTQKKKEFLEKVQKTRDAEATLRAHSINTKEELMEIQKETQIQKAKLPMMNNNDLKEISQIDDHAKVIFENILKLEVDTKGFSEKEFLNLSFTEYEIAVWTIFPDVPNVTVGPINEAVDW